MLFIKHLIDRLCYQQFRYAALIGLQKDKSKFSWLSRSSMSFRHFLSLVTSLSESQILPWLESPKKVMAGRTYCEQGKCTTLRYQSQILGEKWKMWLSQVGRGEQQQDDPQRRHSGLLPRVGICICIFLFVFVFAFLFVFVFKNTSDDCFVLCFQEAVIGVRDAHYCRWITLLVNLCSELWASFVIADGYFEINDGDDEDHAEDHVDDHDDDDMILQHIMAVVMKLWHMMVSVWWC